MEPISLNYEASAGDTHKQTVSELPSEVVQCLENARFVRPNPGQLPFDHFHALTDILGIASSRDMRR